MRINHIYFTTGIGNLLEKEALYEKIENNDNTCLEIIDNMNFDVGVQSFLNVNKIVMHHVNMTKSNSKQVHLEQAMIGELTYIMKSKSDSIHKQLREKC